MWSIGDMMTDRELMQQAVEAMEYADACLKKQLTAKTKHEYAQDLLMTAGTALRERLAQPEQKPMTAIRLLTDQCAALIRERDELQKQVWRYEKNGVTCQTYRHKVEQSCSECNVQENYTSPPQRKPLPPQSPCEMTQAEGKMFKLGWLECEAAHGIKGEA